MTTDNKEFKIKSRQEQYRIATIYPVEFLAISTQVDLEKYEQTLTLYTFALEHIEVLIGEKWIPVKTPNKQTYMPFGIGEDMIGLNELCMYFLTEVIYPAFQKSSESD